MAAALIRDSRRLYSDRVGLQFHMRHVISGCVDVGDGRLDGILQRCRLSMKLQQCYVAFDEEGDVLASSVDAVHLGFLTKTLVDTQCEFNRFHGDKLLFCLVLAAVHCATNVASMTLWDPRRGLDAKNVAFPITPRTV